MENKSLEKNKQWRNWKSHLKFQIKRKKTDIVKGIMNEVILSNFSKEYGLTDQQIANQKNKQAQMFFN